MAPTTAKEVCALLREFMENENLHGAEKRALWSILTALRGPDNEDDGEKFATTSVIRYAVFGRAVERCGAIAHPDAADLASRRAKMDWGDGSLHFLDHSKRAFLALGLSWDTENKEG